MTMLLILLKASKAKKGNTIYPEHHEGLGHQAAPLTHSRVCT